MLGLLSVVTILNAVALRQANKSDKCTKRLESYWDSSTRVAIAMSTIVHQLKFSEPDFDDLKDTVLDILE